MTAERIPLGCSKNTIPRSNSSYARSARTFISAGKLEDRGQEAKNKHQGQNTVYKGHSKATGIPPSISVCVRLCESVAKN